MGKIRILLADAQEISRAGVAALLERQPDMEVVGQAGDSRTTLELTAHLAPAVVVLELSVGGIKVIDKIRTSHPATQVLVLTMHDDPTYLHAARALGCAGFMSKADSVADLLEGIRRVHDGKPHLGRRLACRELPDTCTSVPCRCADERLTAREKQVLQLLAQGFSHQRIASALFLSVKTIETYRTRIGQKLAFDSRADLVRYALETGLMGPCQAR